MKTYTPRLKDVNPEWKLIDAKGKILGRLSVEIAKILLGKNKALYDVNLPMGDKVIIVNAKSIAVTGKKEDKKIYYRHTGYPGGIKAPTYAEVMAKDPAEILFHSVKGMLPKGPRGYAMLRNLFVYAGSEHPHQAQQPQSVEC